MADRETIGRRTRQMWEYAQAVYAPWFVLIEKELSFLLKLRHHLNDMGETLDKRLVQYRGREAFAKNRRKVADICKAPLYIEALPVNEGDPRAAYSAEDSKWALEHDIRDPMKGFDTFYERAVIGALAARKWWLKLDWDPDLGPFGDAVVSNADPQKVFLCPPFQDAWDPRCPWLMEEVQMHLDEARRMTGWKDTDLLIADNRARTQYSAQQQALDEYGRTYLEQAGIPDSTNTVKGTVTILKTWFRRDPDKRTKRVRRPETEISLAPHEQYDACTSCGWTGEPGVPTRTMPMPGAAPQLPGTVPGADGSGAGSPLCPACLERGVMTPLAHITHTVVEEEVAEYPDGVLVIYAPFCDVLLYEGPWPFPARTFPYCALSAYEHPRDAIGVSDTTLDMHVQIVSNALKIRLYDSVMAAPNVVLMPGGSELKDANGAPFQLTDEPWQVAYFDEPFSGQGIQHFQAPPVPGALFSAISVIDSSFRADLGTAEFAPASGTSQDMKSIPVGTVNAFIESGSVPTDHHIRRFRRELSIFFSVWHDMQRAMWTAARWVRLKGPQGLWKAKLVRGASLPGVDIVVTAEPEFKARTKEELDTIAAWMGQFGGSEAIGQLLGIPPTIAEKLKAEKAKAAAAAAPPAPAGPNPAGPVPPMPGPSPAAGPPPVPMMNGPQ